MEISSLQIFCDFDGTITRGDTVDLLLEKLALDEWRHHETLWEQGKISAKECMSKQVPLIQGGWSAVESVLTTVELDPGLGDLVEWCSRWNVPFSIVSDGLDRVIYWLLERAGVSSAHMNNIWANHLLIDEDSQKLALEIPTRAHRHVCPTGHCKCQILDMAPPGTLTAVIGDGRSDFCWAHRADLLFAKDGLLKHCRKQNLTCMTYDDLSDVRAVLQRLIDEGSLAVA